MSKKKVIKKFRLCIQKMAGVKKFLGGKRIFRGVKK